MGGFFSVRTPGAKWTRGMIRLANSQQRSASCREEELRMKRGLRLDDAACWAEVRSYKTFSL
jgi:hypothetical protein